MSGTPSPYDLNTIRRQEIRRTYSPEVSADIKARQEGYQCAVAVLDDLLLNCCLPPLGLDEGFRQGLLRLIEWEVKVALDPQVSTEAVRLKREGAVKELKMLHIELSRANFREIHDILSGDDLDSIRRLVSNRIAALEAEG